MVLEIVFISHTDIVKGVNEIGHNLRKYIFTNNFGPVN
jgi:hypothetical protein